MRVAIFHDFLIERGGGERVVDVLSEFFKAILIVCFYDKNATYKSFEKRKVFYNKCFLNEIAKNIRNLKLLRTTLFFNNQLKNLVNFFNEKFDIAIFSGFYSPLFARFIKIPKIYYIQAEPLGYVLEREAYKKNFLNLYNLFYKFFLKELERKGILSMDKIIANSNYTKKIYEHFFKVKVDEVIYPPVKTSNFYYKKSSDFFLAVGRLYPHKRVHVVVKTFTKLKSEKLVVVGKGPLSNYVQRMAKRSKNIVYLGGVSDKKLRELYATCKAVIYIPEKEHFGIVPVEANASGKPAIISYEGGLPETIIPNKTGIFVKPPLENNLLKTIKYFDRYNFNPKDCIKNAKKFDIRNFFQKMKKVFEI
jgi:glycosyltransferase involved in cell wall biosynthesis